MLQEVLLCSENNLKSVCLSATKIYFSLYKVTYGMGEAFQAVNTQLLSHPACLNPVPRPSGQEKGKEKGGGTVPGFSLAELSRDTCASSCLSG